MLTNIDSNDGEIRSIIGFGYNPKKNNTATIIDSEIPSFQVISENTFVFVSPNIDV